MLPKSEWRLAWAEICNGFLKQNGHAERIDHRSYERQGIDQIPTIHLGVAASQMEKRGIVTERGNLNREIEVSNQRLRQLKARMGKLQNWLKEETENTTLPTLADYIQEILSRKAKAGKSHVSQSVYNLKDAANMLNFLTRNHIMDMVGLDEKFSSMIGEQFDIRDKLKPIERRLPVLKKHIEQANIYLKYKGKKKLNKADQILFTAANAYLKGVMNGKTTLPTRAWKEEYARLTAERKTLNQRYLALKDEVKEADQIRKSVYSILRQKQREQSPRRAQDMDR
ncbi:MobA/MobL family protein [Methanosarcina spelaei]|uniref:MobA/MobL family protein n=1 Tax=Methanosarcina spelaei TaxID=1036679 RepID=UPI000BABA5A0|nr:MobA/MobL family protein [Methanosarcina spelaei]